MIVANMFDTDTQRAQNVGTFEFSKTFATALTNPGSTYIDNNDATFNDAYWLGWIRPENVPTALRISYTTYDSQADKFTFTDSTKLQNFNIGYAATLGVSYTDFHNASILKYSSVRDSITEKWRCMPEASEEYFTTRAMLNQFYIGCVNFSRLVVTYTAVKAGIPYNTLKYVDAADFEEWKTADVEITVEGGATKTISNATLNENNYIQDDGYGIFISAYRAEIDDCVDNNLQTFTKIITTPVIDLYATGKLPNNAAVTDPHEVLVSGLASPYLRAYDAQDYRTFEITELYGRRNNCVYYATSGYDNGHSNVVIDRRDGVGGNIFYSVVNGFTGDLESMMNKQQASQLGGWSGFWPNSNTCFGVMAGTLVFCRMYTPEDIVRHMSLMPRWKAHAADTPTYGVVAGVYYPEVLDSGEFTGRLITGTVAQLYAKLQPWQYDALTENDYDSANLPPYEPPGPGEDGRWGGDNIRPFDFTNSPINATNNFTTLYALSSDTVIDFGQKLWAGLSDPAFWHMVGVEFSNDFSINPADMMHYFLSLRYYPFDLDSYATQTTGIYIGRATTAITPSVGVTLPYLLNRNVIQIDGGKVFVQLPKHNTGDFRVYDPNTQITAYIPFCGAVQLAASEVYGSTLSLQYTIDMQTGSITAAISAADDENHTAVVATLGGSISADIQITANNNIEFLQRIASVVTGTVTQTGSMAMQGAMSGGEIGAAVGAVAGALSGGVASLAGLPPVTVHKQGTSAGFAGYGGVNRAYITIQTGVYDVPEDFAFVHGWRCNVISAIGDLTGFTVCSNVNTDGLTCTSDEAAEIKRILESGFYA